jgi:hypothetical protein
MASGLRSKAEAVALAGCDFLVVGPKVLAALSAATTLEVSSAASLVGQSKQKTS